MAKKSRRERKQDNLSQSSPTAPRPRPRPASGSGTRSARRAKGRPEAPKVAAPTAARRDFSDENLAVTYSHVRRDMMRILIFGSVLFVLIYVTTLM